MTGERLPKPAQPIDGQASLPCLQVADLLVCCPDEHCQRFEGQAPGLP